MLKGTSPSSPFGSMVTGAVEMHLNVATVGVIGLTLARVLVSTVRNALVLIRDNMTMSISQMKAKNGRS